MKYNFLRISLLSALTVLFGGVAVGAFRAAAANEQATDENHPTWSAPSEAPAAGTAIVDNDLATIETVFATTAKKDAKTFGDFSFSNYIQVRVKDDPTADEPTGTDNGGSTPLVVTAKKNIDVTFFFRRQKGTNGYEIDDNKDLLCYGQNESAYEVVEENIFSGADEDYAYVSKTWKLVEGGVYTIYRRGSTMNLYGIDIVETPSAGEGEESGFTLPVNEDFEGETSIFEGGEIINDANVGKVLKVKNTTATASFSPAYTLAENETVTFQFTAYQGWTSSGNAVVSVKNSEDQDLVSYTYDFSKCSVIDVAIGGTTVDGFETFFGQSNSTNAASKGSANIFGHGSQPFVATENYNPIVTMSVSGTGTVEFNLQYLSANSTPIDVSYSGTLPEGTKIDLGSFVLENGNNDAFGIDNLSITTETAVEEEPVSISHRWDFTQWSDETVANLKADAALGTNEGWSDDEKNDGNTDATAGNCFWSINTPDEIGGLSANNVLIDELKGLKFGANVNNRGLAIAVNYPYALSEYKGGAYLWLGGANKKFFTIPAVKAGSTLTMGVESHKTTDARGVDLLVDGVSIGEFKPTTYEEYTWTVPEGEAVDVVVDNTNGCHIYFIEVEQDAKALLAVATADLKTVIAAVEAIEDLSVYTEESVQALNSALAAAKVAEETIEAQTEAAYALLNAKAALQKSAPEPDPVMVTYKVNEVAGDIIFRTTEGEALEGTAIKVPYRLYNADENGQLYKKGATSKEYNYSFTLTTEGQVENIEYAAVDGVDNVVFIAEGEDIEGLTPITTGNAAIRSSNAAAGHATEDTEIVTMEAGVYVVHAVMYDATKNGGEVFTFKAGDLEKDLTAGENLSEGEFELTLTETTTLVLAANSASNKGLDAIYIVRTGGVATGINTVNAQTENGVIYNLQGQKVQKAQKGLYIVGGKKVLVK